MMFAETLTGIRAEIWTSAAALAFAGFSLSICNRIWEHAARYNLRQRQVMTAAFLGVLLFLFPKDFTQREHFGVIAMMPLLVLYAEKVERPDWAGAPVPLSVLVGVMASLLIMLKPHYAIGYVAAFGVVLAARRRWQDIAGVEHLAGGITCALYGLSVVLFFRII